MEPKKHHVVILPYYCQDEVDRYLEIARLLKRYPIPDVSYSFLLAASPLAEKSDQLLDTYSELAPTLHYQCPTQVFGYPEGPSAMFWDSMDFIAENFKGSNGFSLWLESDMCPVKSNWLDRLSKEWYSCSEPPVMMGCYVPEVYKPRFFRQPKLILDPHINGGACYAIDFANQLPAKAREGVFDMAVYGYSKLAGHVQPTEQIAFSSTSRVRRDIVDPDKVLVHGFMQDKNKFIEECIRPLTPSEKRLASASAWRDQLESFQRRIKVRFVRKGHRAMLENMLLAKEKFESSKQYKVSKTRAA